jgi:[ribosomal protein S18]-alanine N-acetyltransferase
VIRPTPSGLFVRPATPTDVPAMMNLERQSSAAAHWPHHRYEAIFAGVGVEPHVGRLAWAVEQDRGAVPAEISAEASEQILGFLVAHQVDLDWELENIVVAQALWRKGVGSCLLEEFIAHVRIRKGASILLEVRESNHAARALYRKTGFVELGQRKDYYSNPSENAVVYRLKLTPGP